MAGVLFALSAAFLWGTLPIYLRVAAEQIPILTIVWFRYFLAFVGLSIFQLWKAKRGVKVSFPPARAVFCGIFLTLSSLFYAKGAVLGGPTNAELLIKVSQPLLILSSYFLFKERFSKLQLAGFILTLLGFFLYYSGKENVLTNIQILNSASFYIFISATLWSVFAILQKKLIFNHSSGSINLLIYATGAVLFLPFVAWSSFADLTTSLWIILICTGLNTLLGYGAYGEATSRIDLSQATMLITISPIFTYVTMQILEKLSFDGIEAEHIEMVSVLGMLIVVVGVMLVVIKKPKQIDQTIEPEDLSPEGPH